MTHVPPRSKLPLVYSQAVFAPYHVAMMPDGLWLDDLNTLEDAIGEFVRYCLPPIDGRTACVSDSDGVVAIGYHHDPFAEDALRWVGVKAAVLQLRSHRLVEPLLMASIEMALEPS